MRIGAVRDGDRLHVSLEMPAAAVIRFDHARHRRLLNLDRNYVRLNEFPEWFVVDENTLYRLSRTTPAVTSLVRLGSELIEGVRLEPGTWVVELTK